MHEVEKYTESKHIPSKSRCNFMSLGLGNLKLFSEKVIILQSGGGKMRGSERLRQVATRKNMNCLVCSYEERVRYNVCQQVCKERERRNVPRKRYRISFRVVVSFKGPTISGSRPSLQGAPTPDPTHRGFFPDFAAAKRQLFEKHRFYQIRLVSIVPLIQSSRF